MSSFASMRPVQRFRYWLRRAPAGERAGVGAAAAVVLALLVWSLAPGGTGTSETALTTSGGIEQAGAGAAIGGDPAAGLDHATTDGTSAGPGAPRDRQPAGDGMGPTSAGAAGPVTPAGGGPGAGGCQSPPGSARGITTDEVRVAVALTQIAGPAANGAFGLPSASEQRRMFEAVIAGINREGGVACRRLVAEYHEANPADEGQMQGICLDVAEQEVFAMVDTGALSSRPSVITCFGQREIPFFTGYIVTESVRRAHYPYIFGFTTRDQLYEDTVVALQERGFFGSSTGFRKLGFLVKTCQAEAIAAYRGWLADAGLSGSRIVEYDIGCPSAFASPADLQQAVLTFQRAGVSHVLTADIQGDLAVFTNIAEQQRFRPRYAFPDESVMSLSYGAQRPNPDNIAGAISVAHSRQGEERTPGATPTEGTTRCNAYYEAAGLPPVYEQQSIAGNTCDELWMLRAALGQAPRLGAEGLPEGLQRTGSIDFSFPQAPNDFRAAGTTTGGQFWRVTHFVRSCECWQVLQPEFRRSRR